ncbi:MAG: hypothetical protein MZV64_51210 [Ignavibacteriales bacterium]|nr:hypothetical protein [Ignavibacteriales bacterium]
MENVVYEIKLLVPCSEVLQAEKIIDEIDQSSPEIIVAQTSVCELYRYYNHKLRLKSELRRKTKK